MYARYTAFELDPSDRERVPKFWSDVGGPSAARQPEFVQALITESDGHEGAVGNLA
jgi:hypothetical protein